jgi:Flp pilus assembly protein TadG
MRKRVFSGSRGAVVVEAALVTPLLLLIVFGIIEMAFLMKDNVALSSLVRQGGRIASAHADAGPGDDASQCTTPNCHLNAPKLAQYASDAIDRAGTALPRDSIDELWVYQANKKGYPCLSVQTTAGASSNACSETGSDSNQSWVCTANCVKYRWFASDQHFHYVSGTWTSSNINGCAGANIDTVGVYMKATHSFLTGLIFEETTMSDHAVFNFEPLQTGHCDRGGHQ